MAVPDPIADLAAAIATVEAALYADRVCCVRCRRVFWRAVEPACLACSIVDVGVRLGELLTARAGTYGAERLKREGANDGGN